MVGFHGEFLFAETPEEARLMVIGRKGFLPIDGAWQILPSESALVHIPLVRDAEPILRNYCAFWRKDNANSYTEAFAALLKAQFKPT